MLALILLVRRGGRMRRVIAEVVRVTGTCNAGYIVGDKVIVNLDNACIDKEQSDNLCIYALSAILANLARIRGDENALASCPDPATGHGGNVIFRITKKVR
jgi:uncharacterized repeat protein (TIGR04076 family)